MDESQQQLILANKQIGNQDLEMDEGSLWPKRGSMSSIQAEGGTVYAEDNIMSMREVCVMHWVKLWLMLFRSPRIL